MRLPLKILKWSAFIVTGLMIILFVLSLILQDNVVAIFLRSVNSRISTRVEAASYRLSLLKRFPKAAVELKNITIYSSPLFDKSQFPDINTDTLLFAESASLEFSMLDLIRGNYDIGSITVKNGRLGLYSDSSGFVNYEISSDQAENQDDDLVINLEKIIISDIQSHYINKATKLYINGLIHNGRIRSRIAGEDIEFLCTAGIILNGFDLYSSHFNANAELQVDLNLQKSEDGILFRKGSVNLEGFDFDLTGHISPENRIDLSIEGRNIDLSRIKKYLPEKYIEKFGELSPEGLLKTTGRISGMISRKDNPNITASFSLDNGNVYYRRSGLRIRDISFSGSFTNGQSNSPVTSSLEVYDFRATPGSSAWSGSFSVTNFREPYISLAFSGDIIPSELLQFVRIPEISRSEGSVRMNLKLSGKTRKKEKYSLADVLDLKPEANMLFSSFSISINDKNISIDDADGNIMMSQHTWADDLAFTFRDHRFKINGEFRNLAAWLAGKPVQIGAIADISVGDFKPDVLFRSASADSSSANHGYRLPDGIDLDIRFNIDNFEYKDFSAGDIRGTLSYTPGILTLNSLLINSMDGVISGNCLLARGASRSFVSQGKFAIENVDVNKAFRYFRNFGQDFLVSENLAGSVSGSLTLLMPLDSMLKPDIKATTAEGKYVIVNGVLKDFEPVKALSRFIELSELEKITFSRLENDLFIKNNYLAVPQMDIKSSAADFTVSGRHDFDNNYEYHVKAYLSEILSSKARKGRGNTTEFGAIEEDGLGRTSVYLRVTGNDEDIKVVYDFKAAGNTIKQNLRNEKVTLRNILNEEYGLFKNDTSLKRETAPKPKFRIEFPETDTTDTVRDTTETPRESLINRLLKKKKGILQ